MKPKMLKNVPKGELFAFLLMANAIIAFADSAVVVSKRENIPDGHSLKTRIFLDISNSNPSRANAYVDIIDTDDSMAMQEFGEMVQVGDVIEYAPRPNSLKDGRYDVIFFTDLLELNGRNIYGIFLEDLKNESRGSSFSRARREYYEARQRSGH